MVLVRKDKEISHLYIDTYIPPVPHVVINERGNDNDGSNMPRGGMHLELNQHSNSALTPQAKPSK